jgi:hypothetical protein
MGIVFSPTLKSKSTPALFEAMKSVHEGDTLVVWKLDRLARSARHDPAGTPGLPLFGGGRGYARRSEPSGRHDRAVRVAC